MKPYVANLEARKKILATEYGAILADDDLEIEVKKRRKKLVFPLHIFPEAVSPFINSLLSDMKAERGFVGLTLLQAASSAIGSGIVAATGTWETNLSVWGCVVGISSSGKSMTQGMILRPLFKIQRDYDERYDSELERSLSMDEPAPPEKVFIYSDITFEALTRDVLGHNFKGVTSYHDELAKWLDDFERYKNGGSEQSFYTAAWSPNDAYTVRRTSKSRLKIAKDNLVISVVGTTQPGMVSRFYDKLRLETGYVFRILWSFPDEDRVISPKLGYKMTEEVYNPYCNMLERLFKELPMNRKEDKPRIWELGTNGIAIFQAWQDRLTNEINAMEEQDRNVRGGVFGKIKEYVLRFSAILQAMHLAARGDSLDGIRYIDTQYVEMAIEAATYFFGTGMEAYQVAYDKKVIPAEVLQFYYELKAHGGNMIDMAATKGVSRQAIHKKYTKYANEYKKFFNPSA